MEVNHLKKIAKLSVLSLSLTMLPIKNANAVVPVTDFGSIEQIAVQTGKQLQQFAAEMSTYAQQMAQEIQLFGQQMRSDFNRSVMEIGSVTQVQTDILNQELLSDLQPVPKDACVLISANQKEKQMSALSGNLTSQAMSNYNKRNMPKAGEMPDPYNSGTLSKKTYRENLYQEMENLDEQYGSVSDSVGEDAENKSGSVYLDPSYLFIDNMSQEEFRIANIQKEILAGPPNDPFVNRPLEGQEEKYKQEFVTKTRKQLLKSSSVYAIQDTISQRYAVNGLSKIGTMEAYLDETIRSSDWIKKYTNTEQDVNKLTTSSQVTRSLLGIEAKRLELETMNYKQMEQIKILMALSSLIELDNNDIE